ncbi:hypothetical protein [Massilia sp. METH4]|uniref:hypothetical protein n=1 Tax=Massilia sp. METH4 TaxID=3123041 RepID=UPI0030CE3D5E
MDDYRLPGGAPDANLLLQRLTDELEARHAAPFTACFFDDHWLVLERLLSRLREPNPLPNIDEETGS